MTTLQTEWKSRVLELYRPDLDRLQGLFESEKYEKFLTEFSKWNNQYKRTRKPFPDPWFSYVAVIEEFGVDLCRMIRWFEFDDIFLSQEAFDRSMERLAEDGMKKSMAPSVWLALNGQEEKYRALYRELLEGSDEEIRQEVYQDWQSPPARFVTNPLQSALEFDRHDRAKLLADAYWPVVSKSYHEDLEGYGEKHVSFELQPFHAHRCVVEGTMLWIEARSAKSRDKAIQAVDRFFEALYHYCVAKESHRDKIQLEMIWPMAIAWEFDLMPDFDWDLWIACFQYHTMCYEPWRRLIREKNLTMPPLDISMLPPEEERNALISKYVR